MGNNETYEKLHKILMSAKGQFSLKQVIMHTFFNCPDNFTKAQIEEFARNALNLELSSGMVKKVGNGVYETILSQEKASEPKI